MGACTFITTGKGDTPDEAFKRLVMEAEFENGHSGYTGTIAEKGKFVSIPRNPAVIPQEQAMHLLNAE